MPYKNQVVNHIYNAIMDPALRPKQKMQNSRTEFSRIFGDDWSDLDNILFVPETLEQKNHALEARCDTSEEGLFQLFNLSVQALDNSKDERYRLARQIATNPGSLAQAIRDALVSSVLAELQAIKNENLSLDSAAVQARLAAAINIALTALMEKQKDEKIYPFYHNNVIASLIGASDKGKFINLGEIATAYLENINQPNLNIDAFISPEITDANFIAKAKKNTDMLYDSLVFSTKSNKRMPRTPDYPETPEDNKIRSDNFKKDFEIYLRENAEPLAQHRSYYLSTTFGRVRVDPYETSAFFVKGSFELSEAFKMQTSALLCFSDFDRNYISKDESAFFVGLQRSMQVVFLDARIRFMEDYLQKLIDLPEHNKAEPIAAIIKLLQSMLENAKDYENKIKNILSNTDKNLTNEQKNAIDRLVVRGLTVLDDMKMIHGLAEVSLADNKHDPVKVKETLDLLNTVELFDIHRRALLAYQETKIEARIAKEKTITGRISIRFRSENNLEDQAIISMDQSIKELFKPNVNKQEVVANVTKKVISPQSHQRSMLGKMSTNFSASLQKMGYKQASIDMPPDSPPPRTLFFYSLSQGDSSQPTEKLKNVEEIEKLLDVLLQNNPSIDLTEVRQQLGMLEQAILAHSEHLEEALAPFDKLVVAIHRLKLDPEHALNKAVNAWKQQLGFDQEAGNSSLGNTSQKL